MGDETVFYTIKFISRLTHMLTVAILSGEIIYNYMYGISAQIQQYPSYKRLHMIVGSLLVLSGFFNIFLIKGKKKLKSHQKIWLHLLELKFVISVLFLTPLYGLMLSKMFGYSDSQVYETKTWF